MTAQEFEALPDVTPSIDYVEKEINGKTVRVPSIVGFVGALYQKKGDGIYTNPKTGDRWLTGWHLGQHVKRRVSAI